MKRTIDIDAASFFQSGYKRLNWTKTEQTDHGPMTSVKEESVTHADDLREAIKDHLTNITSAIQGIGNFVEYETTLSFGDQIEEDKKDQFTQIFNEYNTRDESN